MLRHLARRAAHSASSVPRYYLGGLGKRVMTAPLFLWAQAIAFKTLVTLLPLILLATGVFGLIVRGTDPFETVAGFLRSYLPEAQSGALVELVFELQKASGAITFVGGAAFLVTVVTLFSTLRYVIAMAMGEDQHQMRGIVEGYLYDFRMMLQAGTLFLISFGVTVGARLLSARSARLAAEVGLDPAAVRDVSQVALQTIGIALPYLVTVGMLAQLYYFIPRPRPPLRSAFVGAAAAALLFELAKNGFTLYATYVGNFNRYTASDAEGALGGLGGVFGLILAFVFWVYLSGLILIVGAIVTSLHERRAHPRRSTLRRLWSQSGIIRRRLSSDPPRSSPNARAETDVGGCDPPDAAPASDMSETAAMPAQVGSVGP